MTARERAVKEMVGLWVGDDIRSQPVENEDAEALCDLIESAGLRIVDASLYQALVEAVRGYQWAGESFKLAAQHGAPLMGVIEDYLHIASTCSDVADEAHARAVRLLDERGE